MQRQKNIFDKFLMFTIIIVVSAVIFDTVATVTTIHATRHKLRVYNTALDAAQSVLPSDSTTTMPAGMYNRTQIYNSEILCDFDISSLSGVTVDSVELAYKISALSAGTDIVTIYQCDRSWTAPVQHDSFTAVAWATSVETETATTTGWRSFTNSANMKTLLQGWIDGGTSNYGLILDNDPNYFGYEMTILSVKLVVYYTSTVAPTVTTTAISSITSTTASSGGNVTSDGGDAVTVRGICWNTSTGPTTANFKTSDGTGTGVFTSSLTGLSAGTTYYVKAYATNSIGTSYGNEVSFTTNSTPTAIALTSSTVNEAIASGSQVGVLSTTDPDAGDIHTYTLPAAILNNALFAIDADSLETGTVFDYENGDKTYQVSIQTDDGNGGTFLDTFTITINNTVTVGGTSNEIDFINGWQIGGGATDTRQLTGSNYFGGSLDEVRIESGLRSADWIKLCYETQKLSQTCVTFVTDGDITLLPLTVKNNVGTGTSDTIMVYTDNWTIIFDEDIGGGIKFLSDSTNGGGTNQITAGGTVGLFDVLFNVSSSSQTGVLTLLESNTLFVKVQQAVTLGSVNFTLTYTIYGDARLFLDVRSHNNSGSDQTNNLSFITYRNIVGTTNQVTSTATASTAKFVLNADDAASQFDILLSPYGLWSDASGFESGASGQSWLGYRDLSRTLQDKHIESWRFLLDFGHASWDDTSAQVRYYVDSYQSPDSLTMNRGTYRMEKSWEDNLIAHWNFDDATSGVADEDSAYDVAGGTNSHAAKIQGGTWTTGKWGDGALTLATADSLEIKASTDFNNSPVFTITGWIKKSGTAETDALIFGDKQATTSGYKLVSTSDKLSLVFSGETVTGNSALGIVWRFVAATVDNNKGWIKLFVDGKIDTAFYRTDNSFIAGTGTVSIGNSFAGDIDDIRFYAKELSEETIYAIYNNSYRAGQGMYSVRCDNNSSVDINLAGASTTPRYNPIIEIANYWGSSKPVSVYYNNNWQTENTNYIAYLDDPNNILYIGFKKVTRSDIRIYIDDVDSSGAYKIGATKKMSWGTSGSDFYVQNFSGTTFGAASAEEFYFYYKMPTTWTLHGGEINQYKSSAVSPSTAVSSASNQIGTADAQSTMGSFTFQCGTDWISSHLHSVVPTYTVLESSDVRIRLRINNRAMVDVNTVNLFTEWTIYPTGQIFRYDSIASVTADLNWIEENFSQVYDASSTSKITESKWRGVMYGGSANHDVAISKLYTSDKNGANHIWAGYPDSVNFTTSSGSNYSKLSFFGAAILSAVNAPYKIYTYLDIQSSSMDSLYMDSVCDAVTNINFTAVDMKTGTRVTTSSGDENADGFNEREGCYTVQASNNTIDFKIQADGATDGSRFYPAIKITNYSANYKPKFVHIYAGSDTATLIEGYQYNCYLNTSSNYLVIQLDTVLTADVNVYISDDDDLAVTISKFRVSGGDKCDTLFWTTESENENMGFNIYKRVTPNFYATNILKVETGNTKECLSCIPFINDDVWAEDTVWAKYNRKIIPGVDGGTSLGSVDYSFVDDDVINNISYDYTLESVDFENVTEKFGPITVTPSIPETDKKISSEIEASVKDITFVAVPNPATLREGRLDFYLASDENGSYTINIFDAVGNLLYTARGNFITEGRNPDKISTWDLTFRGKFAASGSYLAVLNYQTENGFSRTKKLMVGVKK